MIRRGRALCHSILPVILVMASAPTAGAQAPAPARPAGGLDLVGMDRSVKPGDNFFHYANGTWLKDTPIPPDRSSYGWSAIVAEHRAGPNPGGPGP